MEHEIHSPPLSRSRADEPAPISARLEAWDWLWGGIVGALLLVVYLLMLRDWLEGDQSGLATQHVFGSAHHNILYLFLSGLVEKLLSPADPVAAPKYVSAAAAALGAGTCVLLARTFRANRFAAVVAALLVGFSPVLWYFATTIENHTVNIATISVLALVTMLAPWRRPALALGIVAVLFPLVFWAQQTSILIGPGWIFLVQVARSRKTEPFRWRTIFFVVGPVLLAMLVIGHLVANRVRFGHFTLSISYQLDTIDFFLHSGSRAQFYREDWVQWPGVLVVLGIAGFVIGRFERFERLAFAVLCLVPATYFFIWGVPERGGHFLGTAAFFVVLGAMALTRLSSFRRLVYPLGAALLLIQVAIGAHFYRTSIVEGKLKDRVEMVRKYAGPDGCFVSCLDMPSIRIWLPDAEELSAWDSFSFLYAKFGRLPLEEGVPMFLKRMRKELQTRDQVVIDLAYRKEEDRPTVKMRTPLFEALVSAVQREFDTQIIDDDWWPIMIVRMRK